MKLKKGDNVIVIAGKHKGEKGALVKVLREKERVIIGGVMPFPCREKWPQRCLLALSERSAESP